MRQLLIGPNDSGQRIDKFMGKRFKNMPTALIYKFIRKKCVAVNKKKVPENYILNEGDVLSFFISDEFFGTPAKDEPFRKLKPDLKVAYEDENILIIDKPAGLIVHSDEKESYNTLINHILAYLFQKGEYDPDVENCFAPALCNRIDRNTQGLVIAAKNARALAEMNDIIKNRLVKESGASSFQYLQNVYTNKNVKEQGISVALAVTDGALNGAIPAFRVHGGGFAGTIQAYVKRDSADEYERLMNSVFGEGAVMRLSVRPFGAVRVL